MYPVQFFLPHKAYGINADLMIGSTTAIRPKAIWCAIEKIRPYHTIILTKCKEQLIRNYCLSDINPILLE